MTRTRPTPLWSTQPPEPLALGEAEGSAGRGSRTALCLWLPTFELRLELVRFPELDTASVALLAPGESTRRQVWQVSERAAQAGVRPGMLVSQAVGLCASLTLLEPDPAHYDAATAGILEALEALSPVVEPSGRGRVFVGMDAKLMAAAKRAVPASTISLSAWATRRMWARTS